MIKSFVGDIYNIVVYLKCFVLNVLVSYLIVIGEDFFSNELLFVMGDE